MVVPKGKFDEVNQKYDPWKGKMASLKGNNC